MDELLESGDVILTTNMRKRILSDALYWGKPSMLDFALSHGASLQQASFSDIYRFGSTIHNLRFLKQFGVDMRVMGHNFLT